MSTRRSELHDDLRAVIAAGRELSPEDDALLADVFLDRMGHKIESNRNPQPLAIRTMRRWAGAAVLILALLTGGAFVSIRGASHQGESSVMPSSVMKIGSNVKGLPGRPPGKYPQAPVVPVPKDVPLQPKG